eukprot:TRINITY_DN3572_c1_g2_i3.p2 TRINITY_DN3572_c1_g2~~TRINITY_DN3572_c1_g2_i3.p2  ORF type:complete len:321 (-),score=77.66 TRINITY_DN3572_c1_g2_i3:506-1468(-)
MDDKFEDVFRVPTSDATHVYAFEFDFTSGAGFSRNPDDVPTIQLAVSYIAPNASTGVVQMTRHLRVETLRLSTSPTALGLFDVTDSDALLSVMVHKVTRAIAESGLTVARAKLIDWLSVVVARYNWSTQPALRGAHTVERQLDLRFSKHKYLTVLPRLVYGLFQSAMLRPNVHPDVRIAMQCVYRSLVPSLLVRAVYPVMISFSDLNSVKTEQVCLSRQSMLLDNSSIFLLDAYSTLLVYYTSSASEEFPPPVGTLLRRTVADLKASRNIAPAVIYARAGDENAGLLQQFMIDDGGDVDISFSEFMEKIALSAKEQLSLQ